MKRTFILFLAISFSSFLFAGCGSQGSHDSDTGTGAIAFQAQWLGSSPTARQATGVSGSAVARTAPFGVATVRMIIFSGSTVIKQQDFAASAGQGTITGVPVSTGLKLTLLGINNIGAIVYQGQYYNISVSANQTTNCGTVTLAPVLAGGRDTPWQIAVDSTNVYWTERGSYTNSGLVMKMDISSGTTTTLASGLADPVGIAIDGSYVYWTEYADGATGLGSVKRISIGGGVTTTLAPGISSPWGIAVDGTNVYWAENLQSGSINKMPKGGGSSTTLANGLLWPWAVAVDATSVYWTEFVTNGGAVRKVSINGGGTTLLATSLYSPSYLALDATSVYYTEYGTTSGTGSSSYINASSGYLKKVPLAGGSPTVLASGLNWPKGIGVDSTNVYFTEWGNSVGSVKYVPVSAVNGSPTPVIINLPNGTTTPATGLNAPYNLALDPNDQYVYWTESDFGSIKRALTATSSITIPSAPTGVTATPGDTQVTVSWTASTGATSYRVYYSTSSGVSKTNYTGFVTASSASTAVSSLNNGTLYYFIVSAVNGAGESAASSPAASATPTATTAVPSAPTNVQASAGNGQVSLSWTASTGATTYKVYWSTSPAVSETSYIGVVSTSFVSTVVSGLSNSTSYYFIVSAVNTAGESAASSPTVSAMPTATGSSSLTLVGSVAYSGVTGGDMAVNTSTQQVYISSGMGQQGLIRINASNPASMSQTTLATLWGGGVAVDSVTGRYATTNGGANLYIFNSDDTLYDTQTLTGCGGDLDSDPTTGRFFISTQCSDHIAVYSESSKTLLANIANNGVGSVVIFDPGSGNIFENLTPNFGNGSVTAPLVVSPSYGTSLPFTGFVRTTDGVLKHVYVSDNSGNLIVYDSTNLTTPLHTFTAFGNAFIAADTGLGQFYAVTGGNTLTTYDASTYAQIGTSITLPGNIINMYMAPGDNRLYLISASTLYVYQR
jgi:hypothetical protein